MTLNSVKFAEQLDAVLAKCWTRSVDSVSANDHQPESRRDILNGMRDYYLAERESVRLNALMWLRDECGLNPPDDFGLPSLLLLTYPGWADFSAGPVQ